MNKFAEEFKDVLGLYARLTADLTRIADAGKAEEDPQAFVQSILDNRSCLTEIEQLNRRLNQLYGDWKNKEANFNGDIGDEIRGVIDDVRAQMRQLEEMCGFGVQKIGAWRKHLSDELATVGKGSRYLQMIKPVQENFPKFIDSKC
jgi:hypothetical protein